VSGPAEPGREQEIRAGLERVRARIAAGCAAAGRGVEEITLVVVTKTHPATDVVALARLGVRDVGENREQEAAPKFRACAGLGLRWHFVGQLQTNKARRVGSFADVVHSVDRARLVPALASGAREAGRELDCLIQVSLDGDPSRGGALIADVHGLADLIAAEEGLALRGLMAVAPLGMDPRRAFAARPRLRDRLLADHPQASIISAGMSEDLEAALAEGATHLRVGSAVLGPRPSLGYRPDGG
jgi:pyridoxal phosphate enzyme (YggS family)